MKNNNYSLQVLHHEEVFQTRELALDYLQEEYKPFSLDAEPILVKYGNTRNPNAILAFGTSNTASGSFFAIDIAKSEEQIEGLAANIDNNKEELDYIAEILNGVIEATGLTIDENKIEDKISYDPDVRDKIIGDATTIAQAVSLLSNFVADNELAVEDSESITFIYEVNPNGGKTLKAKVNISKEGESDDVAFNNNIIGIKNDGIYAASNLSYDDVRHELIFTTSGYKNGRYQDDAIVQRVELGEHIKIEGGETNTATTEIVELANSTSQIISNVKLGSNNSIVVKNGGLEANITVDVDSSTNKLIVTIGDERIEKTLPGVELFESAEYNDENEELIITFRTGNTLVIPIHGIIHTWETKNTDSSAVVLTKTVITGGVDTLSGDVKLRSTDNLIGKENGQLYVSEDDIDTKISAETSRATAAEEAIATNLQTLTDNVESQIEEISDGLATKAEASDVYTKTEIDDKGYLTEHQDISNLATIESVQQNAEAIEELTETIDDMKFVTNETNTVKMTMVKETGSETRILSSDVKIKTIPGDENTNIIKNDPSGIYATVSFNYDKATNKITFNDGNGDKVFELNNYGIVEDAIYDSQNQCIILIIKKDDESTERIEIPVSDLVNTWDVENTTNSPIVLTKSQGAEGDILSADVSILNNDHNLLTNNNGSLFVDADSNTHIALWGNEVTTVQGVINILRESVSDIDEMKQDIADLEEDNQNIKDMLIEHQEEYNSLVQRVTNDESTIAEIQAQQEAQGDGIAELQESIDVLDTRITQNSESIGEINTTLENFGNRIETIEEVIRQLIDFGEYEIDF